MTQWDKSSTKRSTAVSRFKELKVVHARFHASAGQIVTEADKGNPERAQDLLTSGEYSQNSRDTTRLLAQLFVRFKG